MAPRDPRRSGERLLALLLRAYPREFRVRYADEIRLFLAERRREPRFHGRWGATTFWLHVLVDVSLAAPRERWRAMRARSARRDTPASHLSAFDDRAGDSMDMILQDARYALRTLVRRPGYTVIAAITLALGIGANTAIFSVVNSLLLRPLRLPAAHELVVLSQTNADTDRDGVSFPNFNDWRERSRAFRDMAILRPQSVNLTGGDTPERISGSFVSASLFSTLRATPLMGRVFAPSETAVAGLQPVTVISEGMWRQRLGADPDVLGRTLMLNGRALTVIGVMPSSFRIFGETDAWIPFPYYPNATGLDRGHRSSGVIARLNAGTTIDAARRELSAIAKELERQYPEANAGAGAQVTGLHETLTGDARPVLMILSGAVLLVLLIACTNVANLQLSHALSRRREMSVRAALGAARRRIVRQLLTESLFVSLLGGAAGLLLAYWGVKALVAIIPMDLTYFEPIAINGRALAFAAGVSLLTGTLFGLAPALQGSRPEIGSALATRGAGSAARLGRFELRAVFVVAQISLSIVLLISAGLLTRSLLQLQGVKPGFDASGVLSMEFRLPSTKYDTPEKIVAFFDQASVALSRVPGASSGALVRAIPFSGNSDGRGYEVEGRAKAAPGQAPTMQLNTISPGYFTTLRIPLLAGRDLSTRDDRRAPGAIVVNTEFARREWPGQSPIGRRIRFVDDTAWRTVIGVVGTTKHFGPADDPKPQAYVPYTQYPQIFMSVVLRSASGDAAAIARGAKEAIWSVDRDQPVWKVRPMDALMSNALAQQKMTMGLITVFASVAMLLAAIGIYGVMSYIVSQRTREVGIRMALGARRESVLRLIVGQGLRMTLVATVIGVAASFGATRLLASQLFGVGSRDPATFVAVPLVLAVVAMLACWLPARRASQVDPIVALRADG